MVTHIESKKILSELPMKNLLTITLALVAITAYPANAATINIGRSDVELTVPEGYSEGSGVPLVVLLHGYTSSGARQERYMKFSKLVDEYNFLYLTPDGTIEKSERKNRFWNATAAWCDTYDSNVDDSDSLRNLIEEVKSLYTVDGNRIFLIGHSNGGFMSHRMAYDHPDTIAAIVSLAGGSLLEMNGPTPQRPVNILQIHGTKDATVKYEGGNFRGGVSYPSANETVEKWVAHNGADGDKNLLEEKLDLEKSLAGNETTITRFDKNGNIELWTIHDGGHVPTLSDGFTRHVIEWLFDHPKS